MSTETRSQSQQSQRAGTQQTLVLLKPDAVHRGLVGRILTRFEERGLRILGMKLMKMDDKIAAKHYEAHVGKPFYPPLVEYMTSGPILAMVLEGVEAVALVRSMMGATNPLHSAPGTIRGDFAQRVDRNIIHGSDSPESGLREVSIFFAPEELMSYDACHAEWL